MPPDGFQNCLVGHHDPQVYYVEAVASQHYAHDVLAYVVYVAVGRSQYHTGAFDIAG